MNERRANSFRIKALWLGGVLVAGLVLIVCGHMFLSSLENVRDIDVASPDGAYTATIHDVDTGAAGSYCQARLRRSGAKGQGILLVDGGSEFVSGVKWTGARQLTVTTCNMGPPDPSWPKVWQGVKIVYNF